jgi:hypothetical protein
MRRGRSSARTAGQAAAQPVNGCRCLLVGWVHADTFPQGIAQGHRSSVFLEQISKRFVSELLEAPAGLKREAVERMPGFGVELDATSDGP